MVVLVLPSGRFEALGKIYGVLVTVFSDASGTFSLLKYQLLSSLGPEDWIRVGFLSGFFFVVVVVT